MEKRYELFGMQEFTIHMTNSMEDCVVNPVGFRLKGKLNIRKLEKSVQKLVNESDAMRFVFEKDAETGKIYQRIKDSYVFTLEPIAAKGNSVQEKKAFVVAHVKKTMEQVGNLFDGDVRWKFVLYELAEEEYEFWFIINHVISDGLSVVNALKRIVMRYNNLPVPVTGQFADYIEEEYKKEHDEECKKVRDEFLASVKNYKNPADIRNIGKNEGAYKELISFRTDSIRQFAKKNKMSIFHCVLLMYHCGISAAFGVEDSLIGVASAARKFGNLNAIGEYLTGFASRMIFSEETSLQEMAVFGKRQALEESKKDVAYYNCFREGMLFTLAYQNFGDGSSSIPFGKAAAYPIDEYETYMVPYRWKTLCLDVYEEGDTVSIFAGWDKAVFTDEIIMRMKLAMEAAAECLGGDDITFRELLWEVDKKMKTEDLRKLVG